jgi:hypothetical protein
MNSKKKLGSRKAAAATQSTKRADAKHKTSAASKNSRALISLQVGATAESLRDKVHYAKKAPASKITGGLKVNTEDKRKLLKTIRKLESEGAIKKRY